MMHKPQTVIFGEVLYDCFPDGKRVLGGAPFNVAWHCQAFGMQPLLISRVGDDPFGQQIQQAMRDWGMVTDGLQIDSQHPSGVVDVRFEQGEPSYTIVENSAWDFIDKSCLPKLHNNSILYHGSLALRNAASAAALDYIKQKVSMSIFVDINLRSPWWKLPQIRQMVSDARWLKLNQHELVQIQPDLAESTVEDEQMLIQLLQLYQLEMLIVTRGEQGVVACDHQGRISRVVPERLSRVADTVGAGDAFSSVLLLGQTLQWPLHTRLHRAQQFASAVVGLQGATTSDVQFYQPFIEAWQL
ncbi:MAG TPA: PfkB family carbohydrate kinase [Gammaproteobacteria bacterium]